MMLQRDIALSAADVRAIADHVRAIDPEDDDLLSDMIEGETSAAELLDMLLNVEAFSEAHIAANKIRTSEISERNARFKARIDAARAGMQKLLDASGMRKWERPEGTVSIRKIPAKVLGDDVGVLPDDLVKVKIEPDKAAIKRALEAGKEFDGWTLSNGGEGISVRRK